MQTTKAYKAASPQQTVDRIRQIIARLSLPVKEQLLGDGRLCCSCRISITRTDDFSIGTNGKGMTQDYALASGYAEFMERYQHRVIVYPNPAAEGAACRFFPDETDFRWPTKEKIVEQVKKFSPSTLPAEGIEADSLEGKEIPFFHLNSGKVVPVPYSLIRWVSGSNGMSAGNILEEALIQGFCEIFERHALQQLYLRQLVPPTIPEAEFEGTDILRRLRTMQAEHGMDFSIKDLSLGEGFPVLGLLVFSPDHAKYILQLGADLSPVIALERCFTEIFQGYTPSTLRFENQVNACEKPDLFNEFKRSLTYGRGRLHREFFTSAPSYAYCGHTTIPVGRNFREDLNNICQWVMQKGYDIYLRDNSFLGFPATHLVVPGLSEIDKTFCRLNRRIRHMTLTENRPNPLFRLRELTAETAPLLTRYIEQTDGEAIDLFTRNTHPGNHVNCRLLLVLLHLRQNHREAAREQLERYCEEQRAQNRMVKPLLQALLLRLGGRPDNQPDERLLQAADDLLARPERIFHAIPVPECFHCDRCALSRGCRYPLLREIEEITQTAMRTYPFRQNHLASLFS